MTKDQLQAALEEALDKYNNANIRNTLDAACAGATLAFRIELILDLLTNGTPCGVEE